jgi:hypothetical protein
MAGLVWLTYDDFADRVGERFDVAVTDGEALRMELVEVTESSEAGGPGPAGEQRRQFSLVFRGPAAPVLAQGSHRLTHDDLDDLELFLVPLGPDAEGMRYEAAFA